MANRSEPKILIINPFGIGDVLFTTPVINSIKARYPGSYIGYWCNLRVKPILESNPQINKVFALSRGDIKKIYHESFFKGVGSVIKLFKEMKLEFFDTCLDFSLDHRYSLFAKIIGIGKLFGFNYKHRGKFFTNCLDINGYNGMHVVEYYLELLNFLDIPVAERKLFLEAPFGSVTRAKLVLEASGVAENDFVIGVAPGAGGSWGKNAGYKHWSALRFAEVADRLIDKFQAKVLILGDETERDIADVLVHSMRNKPINMMGNTGLEILPAVIKNCKLLITNDGGPMHMAVALGVKTVSVFGPVSEIIYGPYPGSIDHVVLKKTLACRPCYNNFKLEPCDRDKECLKDISADEVFDAAVKLLS